MKAALAMIAMLSAAAAVAVGSSAAAEEPLVEGNRSSPVRVLIYEDLQCSDCAALRVMLDQQVLPKYAARVGFEHRDFPLPKHAWARQAAIAARFFAGVRPELGLEYRRATLAGIPDTTADGFPRKLAAFAKAHGVDPARAVAALADARLAALVEADVQGAIARGVQKTPTVFVAGEPFVETFTFDELAKSIDRAIAAESK